MSDMEGRKRQRKRKEPAVESSLLKELKLDGLDEVLQGLHSEDELWQMEDDAGSQDQSTGDLAQYVEEKRKSSKLKNNRTLQRDTSQLALPVSGQKRAGARQPENEIGKRKAPERHQDSDFLDKGTKENNKIGSGADMEAHVKIRRHIRGLLNRLSESNLASIVDQIASLFYQYSRHDVTMVLSQEIIQSISDQIGLLESFVIVYTSLLYCLSHTIGLDLATYFISELISRFQAIRDDVAIRRRDTSLCDQKQEKGNKIAMNIVYFIAFLYILQIIAANLMYDFVRDFIEHLDEFHVELLLKLLKNSGFQLRKDDPNSLREMILLLNVRSAQLSDKEKSSRYKFMMEVLDDLAANKRKVIKRGDSDLVIRWKKLLAAYLRKKDLTKMEPLKFSLADVVKVKNDANAKWLLSGHSMSMAQEERGSERRAKSSAGSNALHDESVLKAAEEQRMNTELRKVIFSILMTSENCLDAFEKLTKLKLKDKQARDIPRIMIHCCGQEKIYNPYYGLVAKAFLQSDHASYSRTFMYCLWDLVKEIVHGHAKALANSAGSPCSVKRLHHLAKFYAFLMYSAQLSWACLKALPFEKIVSLPELNLFLMLLLSECILRSNEKSMRREFVWLAKKKIKYHLEPLMEGLHFTLQRLNEQRHLLNLETDEMATLSGRIEFLLDILGTQEHPEDGLGTRRGRDSDVDVDGPGDFTF